MKNLSFFKSSVFFLLLVASSFAVSSCKEDPAPAAPKTIADVVIEGANFTLLKAALTKAELVATFQAAGTFTVFAPTDDAFKAAGFDQAFISAASTTKEVLAVILKYHVLGTKVAAADIATADNTVVPTLSGSAFVSKNAAGVSINGAKVVTADVAASNGVIHVIDRVILPNAGDLVATLQADPNYSILVAAVIKAGLVGTLQGAGPFTVFAPNNTAFAAFVAPYNSISGINGLTTAQTATLKDVLLYHVVGARVFSTNLKAGAVPTALTGKSVTVSLDGGVKITGAATTNVVNVVTNPVRSFNINVSNGVIHTIDKVLSPL